jgi:hypothetical protein
MADRVPEGGVIDPFDDGQRKEETWDLDAANQTVR